MCVLTALARRECHPLECDELLDGERIRAVAACALCPLPRGGGRVVVEEHNLVPVITNNLSEKALDITSNGRLLVYVPRNLPRVGDSDGCGRELV